MNGMIAWFARNHVAANLLMCAVVVAGLFSLRTMRREFVPQAALGTVVVNVPYPGATPQEIEQAVIIRIEEAIADLPGIKAMYGIASESMGRVIVEVEDDLDVRDMLADISTRVNAIAAFPAEIERPIIEAPTIRQQVLTAALHGHVNDSELRQLAERARDDLLRLPMITQVELIGARNPEISVEIDEDALQRHHLTFDEIVRAIRRSSLDLPAGALRRRSGEILLRTLGQAYTGREIGDLVLRSAPDGTVLRLGEVARIVDGPSPDQDRQALYRGRPALFLDVYAVGDQDLLAVAAAVHDYARDSAPQRLPASVAFEIAADRSTAFADRADMLVRNAAIGLALVFLLLGLFLRLGLAFWVSLGIPISFLGALWAIPIFDGSINMISMFAFILVLGIVVDDAIVVGESVHAEQEGGLSGDQGAVRGTLRVATPVIFAVLTSIVAFSPMLFLSGVSGQFWRIIPLVVIACLFFSLVESLLILPAHLSLIGQPRRGGPLRLVAWVQDGVSRSLFALIDGLYLPFLRFLLRWRYVTIATFVAVFLLMIGVVGGGLIRFIGFPRIAADWITVEIEMPVGTHRDQTWQALEAYAEAAERLRHRLDGDQPDTPAFGALDMRLTSTITGSLRLDLDQADARGLGVRDIERKWRNEAGAVPGPRSVEFRTELGPRGADITVQFSGDDMDQLRQVAEELREVLDRIDGAYNITDTFSEGKDELILSLHPSATALGLRLDDLARQIRQAFYGAEAQRIQRGRDEVRVMVRYPEELRHDLAMFDSMRIRTADGGAVPFHSAASLHRDRGLPTIRREDRRRVINVSCEIDPARAKTDDVKKLLEEEAFPALLASYDDIGIDFAGDTRALGEAMDELKIGFAAALLAMYALMAVAFRSYVQPALIMSAIPFGIIGAIVGHVIMGYDMSFMSYMGLVALAGVVVNDALVLVDAINRLRRDEDHSLGDAIIQGTRQRCRPVLLTTLTTFFGLAPLMLESSLQGRFLIPMGISLAFGVLFATIITLALVPLLYVAQEDVIAAWRWIWRRPAR